jgi:hypothetical protein
MRRAVALKAGLWGLKGEGFLVGRWKRTLSEAEIVCKEGAQKLKSVYVHVHRFEHAVLGALASIG